MTRKLIGRLRRKGKSAIKPKTFSLQDFWKNRNKILIVRAVGGLGDILMHRMLFEDFKKTVPDAQIHFACPQRYHEAVNDHPFIDQILNSDLIDRPELINAVAENDTETEEELRSQGFFLRRDYIVSYVTTTICGRTEVGLAPLSGPHRSDIWANHCGVELKQHNMHITIAESDKIKARELIESNRYCDGPTLAFCPISAMTGKNLDEQQIIKTVQKLKEMGFYVFIIHNGPVLNKTDIPIFSPSSLKVWIALINQSNCIVSVDSAAFHCAGGLGKPLVGIFSWADGLVYSKYYKDVTLVQKHRLLDPNWTCGPCYNWSNCTLQKNGHRKPCITEITSEMIIKGVEKMINKCGLLTIFNTYLYAK